MNMTDSDILQEPCEACYGDCETLCVGYSAPICYMMQCKQCGRKFTRSGVEGIPTLSMEQHVQKRPHMYLEDPKWRAIAEAEIKRRGF